MLCPDENRNGVYCVCLLSEVLHVLLVNSQYPLFLKFVWLTAA